MKVLAALTFGLVSLLATPANAATGVTVQNSCTPQITQVGRTEHIYFHDRLSACPNVRKLMRHHRVLDVHYLYDLDGRVQLAIVTLRIGRHS